MTSLVLLLALYAPAPMARPPVVPAVKPGAYTMLWAGTECPAWFHADGAYADLWHGTTWYAGWWKCEGGVLLGEMWRRDKGPGDPMRFRWAVRLGKCGTAGTLHTDTPPGKLPDAGGDPWRIRPAEGGRID